VGVGFWTLAKQNESKPHGLAGFQPNQEFNEEASAKLPQAEQIACSFPHHGHVAALSFQFFLMVAKQSMNLAVRFVADSVNLRTKFLPRSLRILSRRA